MAAVVVPPWVDRVPDAHGKLCALGAAEPTFFKEDGKIYAAENARTQLAATLQTQVQSIMIDVQKSAGPGSIDQSYVTQVGTFASDAVVQGAQVLSYWYDDTGVRGRSNATYALACMGTDQSIADLDKKLQQTFPDSPDKNRAVREHAKAAFDALDAEAAKHEAGAGNTSSKNSAAPQPAGR